jgi:hypothetical protein
MVLRAGSNCFARSYAMTMFGARKARVDPGFSVLVAHVAGIHSFNA